MGGVCVESEEEGGEEGVTLRAICLHVAGEGGGKRQCM